MSRLSIVRRLLDDPLFRHSLLLMAASQVGNAANILFQFAMMRGLSDADYGLLIALLGALSVVGTPLDAVRTAVAHGTALLHQAGRGGDVARLLRGWALGLAAVAAVLLAGGFLFLGPLLRFYHLADPALLLLVLAVAAGSLFMPLLTGGLQGLQHFRWMAVVGQAWGVVRLLLAALLVVVLAGGLRSAVAAQMGGVAATLLLGAYACRHALRSAAPSAAPIPHRFPYFLSSLVVLFVYGVLLNADLQAVRHYFNAAAAGTYARAATIGRAVIFLVGPIALALFPKVASTGLSTPESRRMLRRAGLYVVGIMAAAAAAGSLGAPWLWRIFTGAWPEAATVRLTCAMLWAVCPLGLLGLLVYFEMAQHRFRWCLGLLPCAAAYVFALRFWHPGPFAVVALLAASGLAATAWMIGGIVIQERRSRAKAEGVE